MKVVTNEEFFCQAKREIESHGERESIEREKKLWRVTERKRETNSE